MTDLSYTHGASSIPLLGETIGENLKRTVNNFPDNEALIVVEQNFRATYKQFWEHTTYVAKGLLHYGIKKGDRVGVWSPNRSEWVILQYSLARIGAILVNINPAYRLSELEYALNLSGIKMVIASKSFKNSDYEQMLHSIHPNCHNLEKILIMENDWDNLIKAGESITDDTLENIEKKLQFDDPINIQYTSGTTGFPKGVTLTHHNVLNNGYFIAKRLNYSENDRVCIPVPFYHCFGMVIGNLACTSNGCCMVIPSEAFDPEKVMATVQQEKCTSLYGVPTMFIAELEHPDFDKYDFSTLRTGVMAGSTCPIETMKNVQSKMHMKEVAICYGMTETSPVSTQTFIDDSLEKRVSTVGKAQDHIEIKVVNPETGEIVIRGETGELCTRGYSVMLGYWNDKEATDKAIDASGWMHTGDLAVMDNDGYLSIVGRIKDLIIRGGENIYPREIEEFLYKHPLVSDIQVIGVPSQKYGEEVMAWVKLKSGAEVSEKELIDFCTNNISQFKIPKYWKFVSEFPITVTGKIRKVEMREISVRELNL